MICYMIGEKTRSFVVCHIAGYIFMIIHNTWYLVYDIMSPYYYYFSCHPTMCSMIFNIDHS